MPNVLKTAIEESVNTDNDFNMDVLVGKAWPIIEACPRLSDILAGLRDVLGNKSYKKLSQTILRNVFLIELVKIPKIETTKFRHRWYEQLNDDPRKCSFEECLEITLDLLGQLPEWLTNSSHAETLALSFEYSLLPYEAPIDYTCRLANNGKIHTQGNLVWYYDQLILRTLKLRKYLIGSEQSPDASFFNKVLKDKIKVKTYLTDRVLTGDYKTNREKRWETHPSSVHFAERKICMAIEYTLVTQLCHFQGFPEDFRQRLQEEGILDQNPMPALCQITGDVLSYEAFRNELLSPTHGKSDFQVGHLNPLKHEDVHNQSSGHTAENISWISADGNRIQGSLSLGDVRMLIKRIAENYTAQDWWPRPRT